MARRSLRKIDPALDLTSLLFELESLPKPFDPGTFFGRDAPLEVEVGSGKGMFLQSAAERNPGRNILGLEIAKKYARYCASRLAKHSLTNGRVLCGDAGKFFHEWLPDACAAAVHVYFPDPWWKKRHKKRRVMNESFLSQIERVLIDEGALHFWTDVEEYFQFTVKLISASPSLQGGPVEIAPAESAEGGAESVFRTHFDRRCQLASLPIYRAVFVRKPRAHH